MIEPEPLWGADRAPAPFLEGHPRLPAAELADALAVARGRCTWLWPEDGAPFARVDCAIVGESSVELKLESAQAGCASEGLILAEVRQATNHMDNRRFSLFVCPGCQETSKHLVYTFHWRCDGCSGLKYRSQRIGSEVRKWEKRDALEKLIGRGRPLGMHRKTLARHRAELAALRSELPAERAEAPREYLYTLQRRWTAIPRPRGPEEPDPPATPFATQPAQARSLPVASDELVAPSHWIRD